MKTIFGRILVNREEVWPKNKVEFPPLLSSKSVLTSLSLTFSEDTMYLGLLSPLENMSALKHSIEFKATVLIDWRVNIKAQIPISLWYSNGLG